MKSEADSDEALMREDALFVCAVHGGHRVRVRPFKENPK